MELPVRLSESIPLPESWRANLIAVASAPLACLPARHLPYSNRRIIEAMRGVGLLSGWDRRGEGLGLYVTLSAWSAWCMSATLEPIPACGPGRRKITKRMKSLEMKLADEVPERWVFERSTQDRRWRDALEILGSAQYRPPTRSIDLDEKVTKTRKAPGRCITTGCSYGVGQGQDRCLMCRERALDRLVKRHDRERRSNHGQ